MMQIHGEEFNHKVQPLIWADSEQCLSYESLWEILNFSTQNAVFIFEVNCEKLLVAFTIGSSCFPITVRADNLMNGPPSWIHIASFGHSDCFRFLGIWNMNPWIVDYTLVQRNEDLKRKGIWYQKRKGVNRAKHPLTHVMVGCPLSRGMSFDWIVMTYVFAASALKISAWPGPRWETGFVFVNMKKKTTVQVIPWKSWSHWELKTSRIKCWISFY